jgi:hypothetical protein
VVKKVEGPMDTFRVARYFDRIPGRIENFSSIAAKRSHWVDSECSALRNVSGKKSDAGLFYAEAPSAENI